jgi:GxxExxY protein
MLRLPKSTGCKLAQPLSGHPNLGVNSWNSCLNPFVSELLYKEEIFQLVGLCMEIHRELGKGHDEVIYKDALVVELTCAGIPFSRERNYEITYKGIVLPHYYYADFIVWDKILFEAKALEKLIDSHIKQVLNYLAASKLRIGLLVNFGGDALEWKRVIL